MTIRVLLALHMSLFAGMVLALTTISAKATDAWTCSYVLPTLSKDPILRRYELSPPDLIQTKPAAPGSDHYHIVQNNDYGLIATQALSEMPSYTNKPLVSASTLVINKSTGDFAEFSVAPGLSIRGEKSLRLEWEGTCLKD
jgi:hypothetical protein